MKSMTGFAAAEGGDEGLSWRWEIRSVNARGLDVRYRGPDGREAVEAGFRVAAQARLARGSVNATLRVSRLARAATLSVNPAILEATLTAATAVTAAAQGAGLDPAPLSVGDLMSMRGVLDASEAEPAPQVRAAQDAAMLADGEAALSALDASRAAEGEKLHAVLSAQLERVAALVADADAAAAARAEAQGSMMARRIEALKAAGAPADVSPERLAQELALIAVKGDVREELDRLAAHVVSARELMAADGAVGRRLDFLVQEFNREANTLCSKADFLELTRIGLELKAVIDQMREQVQNIE